MELLRLENVSKYYTSEHAVAVGLAGINLSFSMGEFVAITGESGSGKSTLAHVLGGILPYESGEMYIEGMPTSHCDAIDRAEYRREHIGFISQNYGILPGNTVWENIESALLLTGVPKAEAKERTAHILEEVELTPFKKRKAGKLSSGQKQRLSIARALAKPSKILIADEPTGNLDRDNSDKIIRLLKHASQDHLVILITHEFEEAKDYATRHIVLADGVVVTDAPLRAAQTPSKTERSALPAKAKSPIRLAPYLCYLTAKSRPVFTSILCLFLAITACITFVFLGTLIPNLDASVSKTYSTDIFLNGSPKRLVVMRPDSLPFTQEDYDTIASQFVVESVERFGYANDYNYHYKEHIDYTVYSSTEYGEMYHPVHNPDDFEVIRHVQFVEKDRHYVRSVPYTGKDVLREGRLPESMFEVLSADPDLGVGDTVEVYIRNQNEWGIDAYLQFTFTVVGTTRHGEGLYFSDALTNTLSTPRDIYYTWETDLLPKLTDCIFFPYDPSAFCPVGYDVDTFTLEDQEFLVTTGKHGGTISQGTSLHMLDTEGNRVLMKAVGYVDIHFPRVVVVTPDTYTSMTSTTPNNQISVYVKDYSYVDRAIRALNDEGYIAISPFRLGSTSVDVEAEIERIVTLVICSVILLIVFVLQCILLRIMFSPVASYFQWMSHTGLTPPAAYSALSLYLLLTTLLGEGLSALAIGGLEALEIPRIVEIYKHFDDKALVLLFTIHFLSVVIASIGIFSRLKKRVFGGGKTTYDMDFTLLEVTDHD